MMKRIMLACLPMAFLLSGCCDHARLDSKSSAVTIQSVLLSAYSYPMDRGQKIDTAWSLLDEDALSNGVYEFVDAPDLVLYLKDPNCSFWGVRLSPAAWVWVKFDDEGNFIDFERDDFDNWSEQKTPFEGRIRAVRKGGRVR